MCHTYNTNKYLGQGRLSLYKMLFGRWRSQLIVRLMFKRRIASHKLFESFNLNWLSPDRSCCTANRMGNTTFKIRLVGERTMRLLSVEALLTVFVEFALKPIAWIGYSPAVAVAGSTLQPSDAAWFDSVSVAGVLGSLGWRHFHPLPFLKDSQALPEPAADPFPYPCWVAVM